MTDATDIIRIEIAEIENRNIYRVWHDGAVLIERTTTPMRAAARVLLDRGVAAPADVMEMVRRGCDQVDMRGTIGAAALPGSATAGATRAMRTMAGSQMPRSRLRLLVTPLNGRSGHPKAIAMMGSSLCWTRTGGLSATACNGYCRSGRASAGNRAPTAAPRRR